MDGILTYFITIPPSSVPKNIISRHIVDQILIYAFKTEALRPYYVLKYPLKS